jgi:hypothetical protein
MGELVFAKVTVIVDANKPWQTLLRYGKIGRFNHMKKPQLVTPIYFFELHNAFAGLRDFKDESRILTQIYPISYRSIAIAEYEILDLVFGSNAYGDTVPINGTAQTMRHISRQFRTIFNNS